MGSLYRLLEDRRSTFIGSPHWIGNLRWFAEEESSAPSFIFRTASSQASEGEFPWENSSQSAARRTLLGMQVEGLEALDHCLYRPDQISGYFKNATYCLTLPMERYGAIFSVEGHPQIAVKLRSAGDAGRRPVEQKSFLSQVHPNQIVWRDGNYTIVFRFHAKLLESGHGSASLCPTNDGRLVVAIAFHLDPETAFAEADELLAHRDAVEEKSCQQWEDYLSSCPIHVPDGDFHWRGRGREISYPKDEVIRRQYWHWQCLLANVYDLPGQMFEAFIAPDKSTWFGTWSNDGPECIRALSLTNRHSLARKCLYEYIRTAIDSQHDLSWYLHASGQGCLGHEGDSGRLSHGVPTIVTAVAEYVSATKDYGFLDATFADGSTVWSRVVSYCQAVFQHRDLDGDGLVEWRNLWEGGADDKMGCFFASAPLEEWISAVVELPNEALTKFYQEHSRPVVNIYEQVFFLYALQALKKLADLRHRDEIADFASQHFDRICQVLRARHWDPADGFYYDWDVTRQDLIREKNQDAFYLLHFLRDEDRTKRLLGHLENPKEFGLNLIPTLAASSRGFSEKGYWTGGYWPRQVFYIAIPLIEEGMRETAESLLIRALCSASGKLIRENINPITETPNTKISVHAYNITIVLALLKLSERH